MAASRSRAADLRCCLSPALFKALGDPTRVAILLDLAGHPGERTVSDVAGCCPVDLSVVSRHLRTLREAGVVEARREGKEVRYRVRYDALAAELRGFADALEACCPRIYRDHPRGDVRSRLVPGTPTTAGRTERPRHVAGRPGRWES